MQRSNKHEQIYYVVTNGRNPGIYKNQKQAEEQVEGYPYGHLERIKGIKEANRYFANERKHAHKDRVYYVVKVGKRPGLYLDKQKALEQINDFPHGKMKRIIGYQRAIAYLTDRYDGDEKVVPNIFIDGSYIQEHKMASYGFIVEEEGEIVQKDCGVIVDHDFINLQSLGAELYAFLRAIEWTMANGFHYVRIIYDSDSIVQLIDQGESHKLKKSKGRNKFIQLFLQYSQVIKVDTIHRSEDADYEAYHEQAHHLSQMILDIIGQEK